MTHSPRCLVSCDGPLLAELAEPCTARAFVRIDFALTAPQARQVCDSMLRQWTLTDAHDRCPKCIALDNAAAQMAAANKGLSEDGRARLHELGLIPVTRS